MKTTNKKDAGDVNIDISKKSMVTWQIKDTGLSNGNPKTDYAMNHCSLRHSSFAI